MDAVVEQDHGIRYVLLEPLFGQQAVAALARDHRGDALVLQPPEQPSQLRAQDRLVRKTGKERLDGVEHDARGAHRLDRVAEADEQAFEVVLARFLDLGAFHAHVVDGELPLRDQLREVEPERRDVGGNLFGVLLERHEHAGFVELDDTVHQEGERQQRLARSRPSADESRPACRQPAARDLVEATDARGALRQRAAVLRNGQHGGLAW